MRLNSEVRYWRVLTRRFYGRLPNAYLLARRCYLEASYRLWVAEMQAVIS